MLDNCKINFYIQKVLKIQNCNHHTFAMMRGCNEKWAKLRLNININII